MNLDELRNMSQQGQNDMERRILQICDPQKIAQEIKDELMRKAKAAAQSGRREATTDYVLYGSTFTKEYPGGIREHGNPLFRVPIITNDLSGPLADHSFEITTLVKDVFNIVQRYVQDNNIKLELETDLNNDSDYYKDTRYWGFRIHATVSW